MGFKVDVIEMHEKRAFAAYEVDSTLNRAS